MQQHLSRSFQNQKHPPELFCNTCEFCETSKNTFSTEHPRTTASDYSSVEGQFCVNHLHTFTKISLLDLEKLKILSLIRTFTF